MRTVIRILCLLSLSAGLAGCFVQPDAGAPPISVNRSASVDVPRYVPVAYLKPPIKLAADRVTIITRYRDYAGLRADDFITTPERVARLWARQRLRMAGGGDQVTFVIEKVGARSDLEAGIEVVTAVLEARLEIKHAGRGAPDSTTVKVDSQTTITGEPTAAERKAIFHQISRDMAKKLDDQMAKAVQTKLAAYLKPDTPVQAIAPPPAPAPVTPATTRVAAAKPPALPKPAARSSVVSNSPVVGADGRLPSSAWRKGWKWKKAE